MFTYCKTHWSFIYIVFNSWHYLDTGNFTDYDQRENVQITDKKYYFWYTALICLIKFYIFILLGLNTLSNVKCWYFFICFILTKKNAFDKILPTDITELKCSTFDLVDHKFCLISYNIFLCVCYFKELEKDTSAWYST